MRGFLLACGFAIASLGAPAHAANLIVNPGFEAGNTGFTSSYSFSPGNITGAGTYDIIQFPNSSHGSFSATPPHGGGLQMVINGASTPNVTVWAEDDIAVLANTNYFFSAWITTVFPQAPAELNFSINGVQIGSTFTAPATTGPYAQFFATWFSGTDTLADLRLVNQNTAFSGNDFAIDDLAFDTVRPSGTPVGGTEGPSVPEPASLLLLGVGLAGLAAVRRRR